MKRALLALVTLIGCAQPARPDTSHGWTLNYVGFGPIEWEHVDGDIGQVTHFEVDEMEGAGEYLDLKSRLGLAVMNGAVDTDTSDCSANGACGYVGLEADPLIDLFDPALPADTFLDERAMSVAVSTDGTLPHYAARAVRADLHVLESDDPSVRRLQIGASFPNGQVVHAIARLPIRAPDPVGPAPPAPFHATLRTLAGGFGTHPSVSLANAPCALNFDGPGWTLTFDALLSSPADPAVRMHAELGVAAYFSDPALASTSEDSGVSMWIADIDNEWAQGPIFAQVHDEISSNAHARTLTFTVTLDGHPVFGTLQGVIDVVLP